MTLLYAGDRSGRDAAAGPELVALHDGRAVSPALVGAKAAMLAESWRRGLPVLDGAVITTVGTRAWSERGPLPAARQIWSALSRDGAVPLVVRSSSTIEDGSESSNAGRFTSVLRVATWPDFVDAVDEVVRSGRAVGDAPMAVLVQPWLEAAFGGVAFGVDPITGAADVVVSVVRGGPDTLVSGTEQGTTLRLDRRGRVRPGGADAASVLGRSARRDLAGLVTRLGAEFDGPQDVEWAIDPDGRLWLLQTRPITAIGAALTGPRLGPGPVAETFPDPLAPLEQDMWVPALREGLSQALVLAGVRRRSEVARSPVVATVGGRVAVDLDLIGAVAPRRRWWSLLDPRPGVRKVGSAWRVGRLRSSLPRLVDELLVDVDHALLDVPALAELDDDQLLLILRNAHETLRALHGHEILMGMLLPTDVAATSVAGRALAAVSRGRAAGRSDAEIVEREPSTLSLVAPRVGPPPELPANTLQIGTSGREPTDRNAMLREALRLRVRWVHELTARSAWELARRFAACGWLYQAGCARYLRLEELADIVEGDRPPSDLRDRITDEQPPLPSTFRLREDGTVAAVDVPASPAIGAGGGRAEGVVHIGDDPPDGAVLVVETLAPALASVLPTVKALVAQTGSPLSHLAILARELGIPTVVAYPDATTTLRPGERVRVDGTTGEVTRLDGADATATPADQASMTEVGR
jgi:pyruvate,water dikinase